MDYSLVREAGSVVVDARGVTRGMVGKGRVVGLSAVGALDARAPSAVIAP